MGKTIHYTEIRLLSGHIIEVKNSPAEIVTMLYSGLTTLTLKRITSDKNIYIMTSAIVCFED